MEVAYLIIAGGADVTLDGRLHLLHGDLERLVGEFPGVLPIPLYVVFKTLFAPEECNKPHGFVVEFVSPSGAVVEQGVREVVVKRPDPGRMHGKALQMFQFSGTNLPELGTYAVRVLVDGREGKSVPLTIEAYPRRQ